ncbi:hypothetical protein V5799_028451 [Amblyomma americanum]|uniref:Uncharacterized protein n=1 Tax=Amblyomma americanum TaxID=6943 RepID=A0AAQ4DCU5_AMBAM
MASYHHFTDKCVDSGKATGYISCKRERHSQRRRHQFEHVERHLDVGYWTHATPHPHRTNSENERRPPK